MELKSRLQRILQILEDVEGVGAMSDLEKDIVLAELRDVYAEIKFGAKSVDTDVKDEVIAPAEPQPQETEPEQEPEENEVEVEILFEEEPEECEDNEPCAEPEVEKVEPVEPIADEERIDKNGAADLENGFGSQFSIQSSSSPRRRAILSLYEDASPIVGEQFHESPSVADAIACPKGVAECAPISSLRGAIGVADRFMLIRELFDGNEGAYEAAIDTLEGIASFDDCVIYIAENYSWRAQSEGTKFMMELLQRKFNL